MRYYAIDNVYVSMKEGEININIILTVNTCSFVSRTAVNLKFSMCLFLDEASH